MTAYPSPSTARLLVLVTAMLGAALFAGTWLHNIVLGQAWERTVFRCLADRSRAADLTGALQQQTEFQACTSGAEAVRGWFAIATAAAAGLAGLVILGIAPRVVQRRRRLRPLGPRLEPARARVVELAGQAGLRNPPTVMLGPAAQRDAFSYGLPHGYRIALPRGLAVRPGTEAFDAVVRHELEHIAHRDVPLAWLARSVGYALAGLLGVPLVLALATRDLSLVPGFAWRAGVLAAAVLLARAAWLRSREHDADLLAARAAGTEASLVATLAEVEAAGSARSSSGGRRARRRRPLANHPTAARRIAVLHRPEDLPSVTFVDGVTVAFFAALTLPLLGSVLTPLLTATGRVDLTHVIAAGVLGPLVGATLGLGLWRDALLTRVSGRPSAARRVAAGVLVGLAAGQVATLYGAGSVLSTTTHHPAAVLVTACAGAGATVLSAGLGELWADAAGRLRRPVGSWLPAVALVGVLFTATLWFSAVLQKALDWGGWGLGSAALVTVLAPTPLTVAALVLAAAAAWALRRGAGGGGAPTWLLDRNDPVAWRAGSGGGVGRLALVGVAAGLAAGAAIVGFRLLSGPTADPTEQVQRYYTYLTVAATGGVAAGLGLIMLRPRRGPGAALMVMPLSAVVAQGCFLGLNTALGGRLTAGFVWSVLRPPVAVGMLLLVLAASAGTVVRGTRTAEPSLRSAPPLAAALVLAAAAATAVIAGRGVLVPVFDPQALAPKLDALTPTPAPTGVPPAPTTSSPEARSFYLTQAAPALDAAYRLITGTAASILGDPSSEAATKADRLRAEVLPALDRLIAGARGLDIGDADAEAAHRHLIASLQAAAKAYQEDAEALTTGDETLRSQAFADHLTAVSQWRYWGAQLVVLGI